MANHRVEYLTSRQEEILRCIRLAITDRGDAPTVSEIAEQVGLRPSSVHYQLCELEAKGAIVRVPGRARGIRLT
ncbi:LexA family transcriptional regulator [Streptomyces sp. CL12-4]|jgi:repressor LexA|uniref:LexA family protein n=1 Tax=Streptomyces sp. CL12-4 TaxID=2810306 RepID=UPI001EFB0268|nr:helix-turn-helix domain-containing protein [Streptomyces sp. CL12-4]MCG8971389.1 MarR family transcriptional regulator [Streptomyces sp. CL12-4]